MSHFDCRVEAAEEVVSLSDCRYYVPDHACERWLQRVDFWTPVLELTKIIVNTVKSGKVIFEKGRHRYVMNGDLFFPLEKSGTRYVINTVFPVTESVEEKVQKLQLMHS